jgi:diguanylate cyclase (GGDEF)-like protein
MFADNSDNLLAYAIEAKKTRLKWVINIRWFLLLLNFFIFIIFKNLESLKYNKNIIPLLILLSIYIIINLLIKKEIHTITKGDTNIQYMEMFSIFMVAVDFLGYFLFVYLTGSLASPFLIMLIISVIINSFAVSTGFIFLYSFLSIVFLITVMYGELSGYLFHHTSFIEQFTNNNLYNNHPFINTEFLLYSSLLITVGYISYYINKNIQEQTNKIQEAYNKTFYISITDRLTGLYDQVYFRKLLNEEIIECKKMNKKFSIIFLDVDHFKNYNDLNGHLMGSKTLQDVAQVLRDNFRHNDILCKFGGDEFVIISKGLDKGSAFATSERLRKSIQKHNFKNAEYQPEGRLTVSLGISTYPDDGNSNNELLTKADTAMYMAKAMGRNRTIEWKGRNK